MSESHRIRISRGNRKMGPIPSVSLPPIVSCGRDVPCARCDDSGRVPCYVVRNMLSGPYGRAIGESYRANLRFAQTDRAGYFRAISRYLQRARPTYFRFHVSGDILDRDYLDRMLETARASLGLTRFLAFTKRADLLPRGRDRSRIPRNLSLIQSLWPGWTTGNGRAIPGYSRAFMIPRTGAPDPRMPKHAFICEGNCMECGMCFDNGWHRINVAFHEH